MVTHTLPTPILQAQESLAPLLAFFTQSPYRVDREDPDACDFAFGNPHEMPLPGFTSALLEWTTPQSKDWFAYKTSEEAPQSIRKLASPRLTKKQVLRLYTAG